jgi:hypothetical protein
MTLSQFVSIPSAVPHYNARATQQLSIIDFYAGDVSETPASLRTPGRERVQQAQAHLHRNT